MYIHTCMYNVQICMYMYCVYIYIPTHSFRHSNSILILLYLILIYGRQACSAHHKINVCICFCICRINFNICLTNIYKKNILTKKQANIFRSTQLDTRPISSSTFGFHPGFCALFGFAPNIGKISRNSN